MDGVQLPQSCRATTGRQYLFQIDHGLVQDRNLTPSLKISNALWMKLISVWVMPINSNNSVPKKLLVPLRDNYYTSVFIDDDSDPSLKQRRKSTVMRNSAAESDSAAMDSNFHWPGNSSTHQKITNRSFG